MAVPILTDSYVILFKCFTFPLHYLSNTTIHSYLSFFFFFIKSLTSILHQTTHVCFLLFKIRVLPFSSTPISSISFMLQFFILYNYFYCIIIYFAMYGDSVLNIGHWLVDLCLVYYSPTTNKRKRKKGKGKGKISRYFRDPALQGNHTINARPGPHVRKSKSHDKSNKTRLYWRGWSDDGGHFRHLTKISMLPAGPSVTRVFVCTDARLEGSLKAPSFFPIPSPVSL